MTAKVAATVPVLPSVTVTSLTDSVGSASLSVIVPSPVGSEIVALTGFDRFNVKDSSISSSTSPATVTETVRVTWPGVNVIAVRGSAA